MPVSPGRILCLGDAMVDILAMLPGPLSVGSDTPAPVSFQHGGAAANTSAWLTSIGVPAGFLGRVGNDAFGRELTDVLAAQGVRVSASVDREVPTGVCLVLVGPDGQRTMVPSAGANDRLAVSDIAPSAFDDVTRLHVSGYSLLKTGSRAAAAQALSQARTLGVPVSVDAASADPIRQIGRRAFLQLVPATALLLANRDEAAVLTGRLDAAEAAAALAERFEVVVVKCGAAGAVVAADRTVTAVTSVPVAALDSTGAGDAFAAGLLGALNQGIDLLTAVGQANVLGARAVSRVGARPL
jgi:sugar/nucleoside kinase (ribokinase family)